MRLYHYTHFDYGLDDIRNHHIKVATLDSVNDPYEWVPCTKEVPSDYAREFWYKKYGNKVGLICLCIDPDNPVMWSHYGDRHSGMVLGFDCALDQFKPVHYLDDRVSFDGIENLDEASRFQLFMNSCSRNLRIGIMRMNIDFILT